MESFEHILKRAEAGLRGAPMGIGTLGSSCEPRPRVRDSRQRVKAATRRPPQAAGARACACSTQREAPQFPGDPPASRKARISEPKSPARTSGRTQGMRGGRSAGSQDSRLTPAASPAAGPRAPGTERELTAPLANQKRGRGFEPIGAGRGDGPPACARPVGRARNVSSPPLRSASVQSRPRSA